MRRWFVLAVLCGTLLGAFGVHSSNAQVDPAVDLPAGWQQLPADEFVALTRGPFDARNEEERSEIAQFAWERFLNNEEFIASSDLATVESMIQQYSDRPTELKFAGISRATFDEQRKTLNSRYAARLTAESEQITDLPFESFNTLVSRLRDGGDSSAQIGDLYSQWMADHDWKSLSILDRTSLLRGLGENDLVEPQQMSARWTCFLVPATTGDYVFSLVRSYLDEPEYKLWINNDLVLDSEVDQSPAAEFLVSKSVSLRQNAPVPIRLEMVNVSGEVGYSRGAPSAALMWQTGEGRQQFIPSTALSPPAELGEGESGLKGEYFGDASFGQLVKTRLDPTLEFAWTYGRVVCQHQDQYRQVAQESGTDLLEKGFGGSLSADQREPFLSHSVEEVFVAVPLSRRAELAEALIANREMLEAAIPYSIARLMETIYMSPSDEHLKLLIAWSAVQPQPRSQPGHLLLGPPETRFANNWQFYWYMGTFLQGPYWNDAEALWETQLERPDGECNLVIAYATTFAAYDDWVLSGKPRLAELRQRLDAKLADDTVTGDRRVTWLLARSFFEEASRSHQPKLLAGRQYLEEATLVAKSDGYKFWALQELASRYTAHADKEALDSLLAERGAGFTAPEQQAYLDQCRKMCDEFIDLYGLEERTQEEQTNEKYVEELRKRIASAQEEGDAGAVTRFEQLLSDAISAHSID